MKTALLLIYIGLILAVIFLERKSPTEAVLWVLVMVCLPYVGALLYLIFGSTMAIKITAYARKKRLKSHYPQDAVQSSLPDKTIVSEEDAQVMRFNATYSKSEVTSYQDAKLYTDGESHYRQLFADIAAAKQSIYIEFYTIQHDRMGKAFVEALTKKAKEGVDVLVMCDFIANVSTPPSMFKPLREAGGQVIRIKPYLTHYRSHRKIVVIDDTFAYIGGMNIGNQYANLAKIKNPWRDTQVRLTGACVDVLRRHFLTDWLCAIRRRDWEKTVRYVDALPACTAAPSQNFCQFISGGVDSSKESIKMCYLSMIRSAKTSIRIQTPYFIPDASILDALKTAAAAGVQIEVMVPGIKASFFLDPVTTYFCGQLLEYGAKVHKYNGYIHAKTMTVDDEIVCIGSVNMDMRSLMVDDEICGVFYANPLVQKYLSIWADDVQHTTPYTKDMFHERSRLERIQESFFMLFAPLM